MAPPAPTERATSRLDLDLDDVKEVHNYFTISPECELHYETRIPGCRMHVEVYSLTQVGLFAAHGAPPILVSVSVESNNGSSDGLSSSVLAAVNTEYEWSL